MNNRNKPCLCNSGKKFKKCCFDPVDMHPLPLPTREEWEESQLAIKKIEREALARDTESIMVPYRNIRRGMMPSLLLAMAAAMAHDHRP